MSHDIWRTDQLTGRCLALALTPGMDPVIAVAELADLAGEDLAAVEAARIRFRAALRDGPANATLQMAVDLLDEVRVVLPRLRVIDGVGVPTSVW